MYKNKIENYQGDCEVLLGKYSQFSDYISNFAKSIDENSLVLDLGTGPQGCNSKFFKHCILHGCDVETDVLASLDKENYKNTFLFKLGHSELPYSYNYLDCIVCSCVIQHLNSLEELNYGIENIGQVLKAKGKFYLMFKAGNNNTLLTHYNTYYGEERTFRVFDPDYISSFSKKHNLQEMNREILLDSNWIPYCLLIFEKK